MPRFVTRRDYDFINKINSELIQTVIDSVVILYKVMVEHTSVNLYGEATDKTRYNGIELHSLIKYDQIDLGTGELGEGPNIKQEVEFRFIRRLLEEREVYPEMGDIILFNENYYEIFVVNEQQLIASRPEYNASVICKTYLTRRSGLNVEPRPV